MPKFVHKNMESTYIEELKQSITLLMNHLDNQPVGASESRLRLPKRVNNSKSESKRDDPEPGLSKNDVVLNFDIEIVVMEVKGLKSLPTNRIVFCVMEVEGQSKLQTDQAEASRPIWDTSGDFKTHQPLPVLKVKLYQESQNILQDMKEVGRVVLRPDPMFTRACGWYVMEKADKKFPDDLKIKLTIRIDKPGNLKMCGWCYCLGKSLWKKYKKRYLCLVQVIFFFIEVNSCNSCNLCEFLTLLCHQTFWLGSRWVLGLDPNPNPKFFFGSNVCLSLR